MSDLFKDMSIIVNGEGTITVTDLSEFKTYTIRKDHVNYNELLKAKSKEKFLELLQPERKTKRVLDTVGTATDFEVRGSEIYYKDYPLPRILVERLSNIVENHGGLGLESMQAFIRNLMENPSKNSVEQLLVFLEHESLGITQDGHFIAYKVVTHDYLDKHTKTVSNKPGQKPSMPRNRVNDNPDEGCSYGYHVGSLQYAGPSGYFYSNGDKCMMVKVNPRDVVSVPRDCSFQKVRVCTYEVLRDVTSLLRDDRVYSSSGEEQEACCAREHEEDFFVYADSGQKVGVLEDIQRKWEVFSANVAEDYEDSWEDSWEDE